MSADDSPLHPLDALAEQAKQQKKDNVQLHREMLKLVKDSNNQGIKQQTLQFVLENEERLCAGCNKEKPLEEFTFDYVEGLKISPDDCYDCLVGRMPFANSVI